jgi:hypothetical protein
MYGRRGGFGFRGSTPPWPYIGRGRGGLPKCGYYYAHGYSPYRSNMSSYQWSPAAYGTQWYVPAYETWYHPETRFSSREHELDALKNEAEAIKAHLKEIDGRIQELESE